MADYTIKNLKDDVDDSAPGFGLPPDIQARFATKPLELKQGGVGYLRLGPGFRMPFGHRHKRQEEVYVLVGGSARLKLDDEVIDVKPFDAIRVPGGTTRCFEAGPDGAEYVAFGAPHAGENPREEAEMEMGWWKD